MDVVRTLLSLFGEMKKPAQRSPLEVVRF